MYGPQARLPGCDASHNHGVPPCPTDEQAGRTVASLGSPGQPGSTENRDRLVPPSNATVRQGPVPIAVETIFVTIGAIAAVRFLNQHGPFDLGWLAIPCLLVIAALLPTRLRKADLPPIALDATNVYRSVGLVCVTGICLIPAAFIGLRLAARVHLPVPPSPAPAPAGTQGWFLWLIYQLMYVAVAEEVFFRGYVQSNIARLVVGLHRGRGRTGQCVIAVASAGCFAAAHVIAQGHIIALVTFLPGLVLAWLFIRTRALLAPILFHGLANVSYGLFASIWMY
jgi:membrane protease YdiL (CAAX protease family)